MGAKAVSRRRRYHLCCLGLAAVLGLLPFGKTLEDPNEAVKRFASMFASQDANGILKIIHPEVVSGKEIRVGDVERFLKRCRSSSLKLERVRIDHRFKSEDGQTERFQSTLLFNGPVLSQRYPAPSTMHLTLLWVAQDNQWWLERPLSLNYVVVSKDSYPTQAQQDVAMRFQTTMQVLDKLGLPGTEDLELLSPQVAGTATEQYRELERLHRQERGAGGVDMRSRGVQVMLEAANRKDPGFLHLYQFDFSPQSQPGLRAVPWDMFRDYVQAAIKLGRSLEANNFPKRAETTYRRVMSLGRQFLDEPGGYQFLRWGLTFQKQGAEQLARILSERTDPQAQKAQALASLASRRVDLLETALSCLDDMSDYRSLKAASVAAERTNDAVFRPWGINTLAILALKGAPASKEVIKAAGSMVLVDNPAMRKSALDELDRLSAEPTGRLKAFVDRQKEWVSRHQVYGQVGGFQ